MELPKRKPNRLKEYDYSSAGMYFLTLCAYKTQPIFAKDVGAIHESPVCSTSPLALTSYGRIVDNVILKLPQRFPVQIHQYVIMPNHVHLLLEILPDVHTNNHNRSILSQTIGYLKMNATKMIHNSNNDIIVWQRSFHDHVIRNEQDYQRIWQYIANNPWRWREDCFYFEEAEAGDL